ncbi:MAG: hypothetical protein BWY52_02346 [Chloroflexi bacterium ADurb.Bin325]|nr:MAG: hypothetical protein BWY52_02346 [Chloroflexi bacterium ADurb.Bin325]
MTDASLNDILFASARASVAFARRCLEPAATGLRAQSSFVTPDGEAMHWHDFGDLEGPGWAANAVGGATLLYRWARYMGDAQLADEAAGLLAHVLHDGFVDEASGFIRPYYDLAAGRFCLNYDHGDAWLCPGSLAKIGVQLLELADLLSAGQADGGPAEKRWGRSLTVPPGSVGCGSVGDRPQHDRPERASIGQADGLAAAAAVAAVRLAGWLRAHVPLLPNGWVPRRITSAGEPYPLTPHAAPDPIYDHSADGLYLLQLYAELTGRGLADWRVEATGLGDAFVAAGGFWGSINHDTYDDHEDVAYASAFRILRRAAEVCDRPAWRDFAYDVALPGLDRFVMHEDRNGVPTKGLLWMEATWDTSYLWENAEAAHAWLEAGRETGDPALTARGLTVLEAIARHHHGPYGFLTEGVDWNNHVTRRHHVDGVLYGDINYTEPLLNHLHFVGPTLFYLEQIGYRPPAALDDAAAIALALDFGRAARPLPGAEGARYFVRLYHPAIATDARVDEALRFVQAVKADGVLLFEASYDMDPALLTLDQLRLRFARLKEVAPRFRAAVPEVHINVMITVGHVDAGSARPERFAFQFQVNEHGDVSRSTACPLDPAFLDYAAEMYRLAAECGADAVWVDDDVRFVLHDVPGMTCFCPHHLAALERATGRAWTRAEVVAALRDEATAAAAQPVTAGAAVADLTVVGARDAGPAVRRAWFDVQEEAMLGLARTIEAAVHGVDPAIRIGLMTIGTSFHAAEGRRTDRLLRTLAGGARPLIRPGSGYYSDWTPAGVLDKSEDAARQAAYLGADAQVVAEVENHPYTPYGKSERILALELALDVLAGMPDLSLNVLTSMGGTGPLEPEGSRLAACLAEQRPFLDALAREWAGRQRRGVGILDSEDYARHTALAGRPLLAWIEPRPWEQMLARSGFPIGRPDQGPHWLAGEAVRAWSGYDIGMALPEGLILDPAAARALIEMGWGERLGLRDVRPVGDGVNELIVAGLSAASERHVGQILPTYNHVRREQLYTFDVEAAGSVVLSRWLDVDGRDRGPAAIALERPSVNPRMPAAFRIALLPYALAAPTPALLNIAHREQWAALIEWTSGRSLPCRAVRGANLYPLAFRRTGDGSWLLALANLSADDVMDAWLDVGGILDAAPGRAWRAARLDSQGAWRPAAGPAGRILRADAAAFALAVYRLEVQS